MNISFKYSDAVWEEFKDMVKKRYGIDAQLALKKLIDYVADGGDVPGINELRAWTKEQQATTGDKAKSGPEPTRKRPAGPADNKGIGFSALKRIPSGDYVLENEDGHEIMPIILPAGAVFKYQHGKPAAG